MTKGKKEVIIEKVDYWQQYVGKRVRLMIEDFNSYPKPRDGIFCGHDDTHIFLKIFNEDIPKPFLKTTIRRVDIFKHGENELDGTTKKD